ncbi:MULTISPECIES: SDR family NAD(P)-dependent oxidoreductase [Leisingera]|jgi:NAD(P)-dependent dehydrogenase (short-subunit alcohol dehydrogenase family)|uniref:SDR family NAD(P)-dependent oxidoreductase n=1 Tax=Leisingera TaxID=191028 RepID=UPI00114F59EE|nr:MULTISPECIES: SDR family oxidoreductase [Leisingera]QDI75345.1 SDR family oxidoreductase [Leisingera aquaemixtae]
MIPTPQDRPVALVTGAARGIGQAIAQALAADYSVAITHLETRPEGDTFLAVRADFRDPEAPAMVVERTLQHYGRIDLTVNNAGAFASEGPEVFDYSALREMFDVNLFAAQGLLAAALPHLPPGAAVISISSVNATLPPAGAALFGASQAALELWTRGMAKELGARGIRVNAVAPGAVNDPHNPRPPELVAEFEELTALGRLPSPTDIAAAVRFLAGNEASFVTGEVLTVSGGYRL